MGPKKKQHVIQDFGDTGSLKQRKDRANKMYTTFEQEKKDLIAHFRQFNEDFKQAVAALVPPLAVPSSKDQCATAVNRLVQKHAQLVHEWQPKRQHMLQLWSQLLDKAATISATYTRMTRDGLKIGYIGKNNQEQLDDLDLDYKHLVKETQGPRDHILLQEQIQKMLECQHDDIKNFILVDSSRFSHHLDWKRKNPPKVVFSNRLFRPGSTNTDLPLEIQSMIYSYSDLESCVTLRQVSRSWYNAFKSSEEFFESKVKERFPWMYPEDEMNTWALCALVFVRRLHSKKWQSQREMNRIAPTVRKPTPSHEVVATELELGEKLPCDFEPLDGEVIEVQTDEVSHWKRMTNNGNHESRHHPKPEFPYLHLKYMQCIPEEPTKEDKFKTVCSDEKKTVIKFKPGGEPSMMLILPPSVKLMRKDSYGPGPVQAQKHHIVVRCQVGDDSRRGYSSYDFGTVYVFPRNKPLHHKNAIQYKFNYRNLKEFCGIHMDSSGNYSGGHKYVFGDTHHGVLREYASTTAVPVAVYNGLIWFCSKGTKVLPTFVDLQQPGVVFYRRDKIVMLEESKSSSGEFRQCTKQGLGRFLFRNFTGGILVIDLANTTATTVVNPNEGQYDGPNIVMGFVNDKFWAKYVSHETMKKYEAAKLWKVKPKQRNPWGY